MSDPCGEVRSQAVGSVYMVLRIAGRYTGRAHDHIDEDLQLIKVIFSLNLCVTLTLIALYENYSIVLTLELATGTQISLIFRMQK